MGEYNSATLLNKELVIYQTHLSIAGQLLNQLCTQPCFERSHTVGVVCS